MSKTDTFQSIGSIASRIVSRQAGRRARVKIQGKSPAAPARITRVENGGVVTLGESPNNEGMGGPPPGEQVDGPSASDREEKPALIAGLTARRDSVVLCA